jgi:pyruvate, water dikinase
MVPFCRTLSEAKNVISEMNVNGLIQGQDNLEIYGMCEIPANVILADEFLDIFDGFSIGSNDLTQLTLGIDRDSEIVAGLFDERNPAVLKLIEQVINTANKKGKYIGICGDAPSTYPDFAQFLIRAGIKSISLSPDAAISGRLIIAEEES